MTPITPGTDRKYAYAGVEYDSREEIFFAWWIDELVNAGYIKNYILQPETFTLADPYTYETIKVLKTKIKSIPKTLLQGHVYTPDVAITWDKSAHGIFYTNIYEQKAITTPFACHFGKSLVEIKPAFDQNNMTREFMINSKWLLWKFGLYVQKVIPVPQIDKKGNAKPKSALFETTFCPDRFRWTDGGGQKRKNVGRYDTLRSFIRNSA